MLSNYLDSLGWNNIGNQGMLLLMQKQLLLSQLDVGKYLFDSANNNITQEGLRLMPNCNFSRLKLLSLRNNIFI